jgi:hypothetical protein
MENPAKLMEGVGQQRVAIIDPVTCETLATGVLAAAKIEVDSLRGNVSEATIALDLPEGARE